MTPLEKAARALYATVTVEMGDHAPDDWDDVGPDNDLARGEWIRAARAVLASIEVDDAMVEVALDGADYIPNDLNRIWMSAALKAFFRSLLEGETGK